MARRRKKGKLTYIAEYAVARVLFALVGALPASACRGFSSLLGNLIYTLSARRRGIAIENLRHALGEHTGEAELRRIARRSCASFIQTFIEIIRFRPMLNKPDAIKDPKYCADGILELFATAKRIHDEAGGAIFVTPHIGNWEVLPHVSAAVGIPLVVVARPPDNPYLRKLLFDDRTASGQVIVPKKNALFVLRRALRAGKSLGLLPDQSTKHGLSTEFFGRPALTTPVPAMLAISYDRPLVVVACCRRPDGRFEGHVSEPIRPGKYESERDEIRRLTRAMNRGMEDVIRRWPDQYLWMHNRWKTYPDKKAFLE